MQDASKEIDPTKTYFTREWGDNVDDWSSHNSPSRVARNWGEQPMRVQAEHYASPSYPVTSYDVLYRQQPQHVGGFGIRSIISAATIPIRSTEV